MGKGGNVCERGCDGVGVLRLSRYNVVGHFKLSVIIVGGVVLFGSPLIASNAIGVSIAFLGLLWHTHLKLRPQAAAKETTPSPAPSASGDSKGSQEANK